MEKSKQQKVQLISNKPYDESFEVDAEESVSESTPTPRPAIPGRTGRLKPSVMASYPAKKLEDTKKNKDPLGRSEIEEEEEEEEDDDDDEDEDDDDDDDDESDDTGSNEEGLQPGSAMECAYDPADYDHLPVTTEIKDLFQYIKRYTVQKIELEHKLKPFIPDYIPAVGDIDAFIKVPRPDGKPDNLGLLVLDEPCSKLSDPTVMSLWLAENSKQHNVTEVKVKSIENPEKTPKAIENWIESISELHRSKAPATVHYTRPMPDIESLMQEWPAEFEELLGKVNLPTADLDCDLPDYVDIICGLLDIPVYKNRIHSLHVLFTLYSDFKNSQHFKSLTEGQKSDTPSASRTATAEFERLTLD